jgi:flagellar biosynthetic protein FliR
LGLIALLLIFETGIHYVFIEGLIQSYDLFTPLGHIPTDLMSEMIVKTVGGSFEMALKIASPHIAIGLMMFLAGGILSRLMPAMQIFFIIVPAQLLIGFFIMMVTLSATMLFFLEYITETLKMIF